MIKFLKGSFIELRERINNLIDLLSQETIHPSMHSEVERVSTKLKQLREEVQKALDDVGFPELIQNSQRRYRRLRRETYLTEQILAGPLLRLRQEDLALTQLGRRIIQELRLHMLPPLIAGHSFNYYCTYPAYDVIFTPITEALSLLNLANLYHELPHIVSEQGRRLYGRRFVKALDHHIQMEQRRVIRLKRPMPEDFLFLMQRYWLSWADEFACDVFATYTVGPAYGWSHLHLCLAYPDPFRFSLTHPSDQKRTETILQVLRRRKFQDDAENIERHWKSYLKTIQKNPPQLYEQFYPHEVVTAIIEDVEENIQIAGVRCYDANNPKNSVAKTLNQAWKSFGKDPDQYPVWQQSELDELVGSHVDDRSLKESHPEAIPKIKLCKSD